MIEREPDRDNATLGQAARSLVPAYRRAPRALRVGAESAPALLVHDGAYRLAEELFAADAIAVAPQSAIVAAGPPRYFDKAGLLDFIFSM